MDIKTGASDDANAAQTSQLSPTNPFFTDQAWHARVLGNAHNVGRIRDNVDVPYAIMDLTIAREMEKRRIREEITRLGLLRRQELEEEVIQEMLMEREIAMRGGGLALVDSHLPFGRSGFSGSIMDRSNGFDLGIDERFALSSCPERWIDGRSSLVHQSEGTMDARRLSANQLQGGVSGGLPFQRQPGETNGFAVKPDIDPSKGQTASLVKPFKSTVGGAKRKLSKILDVCTSDGKNKVLQKDWSCALCQVRMTCEQNLKDHLKGKKHKAKKKALIDISSTVGDDLDDLKSFPEETVKPTELAQPIGNGGSISDWLENKKSIYATDSNFLDIDASRKMDGGSSVCENNNHLDSENGNFKFWCTICKVGTASEAQMNAHRMGKKHLALLKENRGGVIAIKTMPDSFQYVDATTSTGTNEVMDSFLALNG